MRYFSQMSIFFFFSASTKLRSVNVMHEIRTHIELGDWEQFHSFFKDKITGE